MTTIEVIVKPDDDPVIAAKLLRAYYAYDDDEVLRLLSEHIPRLDLHRLIEENRALHPGERQ